MYVCIYIYIYIYDKKIIKKYIYKKCKKFSAETSNQHKRGTVSSIESPTIHPEQHNGSRSFLQTSYYDCFENRHNLPKKWSTTIWLRWWINRHVALPPQSIWCTVQRVIHNNIYLTSFPWRGLSQTNIIFRCGLYLTSFLIRRENQV